MVAGLISTDQWLAAAKYRRTVYGLKGESSVPDSRVEEIIKEVLTFAPSSYNSQPVRINLITGEKHKQFWDIIIKEAEPILKGAGEAVWNTMGPMLQGHKASYGSVVFWERGNTVKESAETHPSAAHMFGQWGEHANAMHQILIWTALELEGLGANLQHLNALPPVQAALRKFCDVPEDFDLKAHLNYGNEPAEHPQKPEKLPISETFKVIN